MERKKLPKSIGMAWKKVVKIGNRKSIISNSVFSLYNLFTKGQFIFYTSLIDKIVYFLLYVLLARSLDLTDYGNFISIMAFLNILIVLFDFGFGFYLQREFSRNSSAGFKLKEVILFRLLLFPIYIGVILVYNYYFKSGNYILFLLLSISFYLNGFTTILLKVIYGKGDYKISFRPFIYSRSLFVIISLIYLVSSKSIFLLSSIFICSSLVEFILLSKIINLGQILKIKSKIRISNFYTFYKVSYPFSLGMLSVVLYDKIDVIFIKEILSSAEVSIYSIAYSFYKLPALIPPIFLIPLYTEMSKYYQENGKINYTLLRNMFLILFSFSCLTFLIYLLSGSFIIEILFGIKFSHSSDMLKILSIGFIFLSLNNLTGVTLNSINKEKYQLAGTIFGVVLNIILNIILLPSIGIYGAVISTIASELLVLLIQVVPILNLIRRG